VVSQAQNFYFGIDVHIHISGSCHSREKNDTPFLFRFADDNLASTRTLFVWPLLLKIRARLTGYMMNQVASLMLRAVNDLRCVSLLVPHVTVAPVRRNTGGAEFSE
jgi:hypothetical protein